MRHKKCEAVMIRLLLMVALLMFSSLASAEDCVLSDSWASHHASLTTPQACVELRRFTLNTGTETKTVRIIRLAGDTAHGDDSRWLPLIENAVNASGAQMRELGGLSVADVTVLLSNLRPTDPATGERFDAHAATLSLMSTECNIVFYKLASAVSSRDYAFTFAHEFFHCIQASTFRTRDGFAAAAWWVEGSAEYFANRVQPGTGFSDGFVSQFDSQSLRVSLLDMDYENVVFFMWLGSADGPESFVSFLGGMPETDGREAQLRALQDLMPTDQWQSFVEAALNGRIAKPGGGHLPRLATALTAESVLGPKAISLRSGAYVIPRKDIVFQRGKNYPLMLDGISNGLFVRMQLSSASENWVEPPESVKACDRDKGYATYWTSVEENASGTLRVGEPVRLEDRTCCLIGNWQPTDAAKQALAAKMNNVSSGLAAIVGGPTARCTYTGGGWEVIFRADGTGELQWDDMGSECTTRFPRGEMSTTGNYSGAFSFEWNVVDNRNGSLSYTDNTVVVTTATSIGGRGTRPMNGPMTSPESANFRYQCSNEQLTLNVFYGLQNDSVHVPAR
jgi:hypothetical protein